MDSSTPDLPAAGDCAETWHHVAGHKIFLHPDTTARKHGRVAGESIFGGNREFKSSLRTQVVKAFYPVAAVPDYTNLYEDLQQSRKY